MTLAKPRGGGGFTAVSPSALVALAVLAGACDDAMVGAECKAGTVCAPLEIVALRSSAGTVIWPGKANIPMVATLHNRGGHLVPGATLGVTFTDATADRAADFTALQAVAWAGTLEPGARFELPFVIEVSPQADPGRDITVDGELRYRDDGVSYVAHATTPLHLTFAPMNPDLVVNTTADSDDGSSSDGGGSGPLSLRKALRLANERSGIDRIVFSSTAFPVGQDNVITVDASLPDLPPLHGDVDPVLLICDSDTVTVTPDHAFDNTRRSAFTVYGPAVVFGLKFVELSRLVEPGVDCTVSPGPGVGSAIVIDGGADAVVSGNHFVDTGLAERPCTQTLVAITGGRNHLITGNFFEGPPGNAITVFSPPALVRGNRIEGGLNCGVVVDAPGDVVQVTGNLITDLSFAGLLAHEGSNVEATNNTFARTGCDGIQALAPARLWLRNNVYTGLSRPALAASVHGSNIDAAFEATDGAVYCYDCGLTHIDVSSMLVGITFAFANPSGRGFEAFTPTAASLLVDSGTDVSDRNGSRPGRFEGSAADRGAVEQSAP